MAHHTPAEEDNQADHIRPDQVGVFHILHTAEEAGHILVAEEADHSPAVVGVGRSLAVHRILVVVDNRPGVDRMVVLDRNRHRSLLLERVGPAISRL